MTDLTSSNYIPEIAYVVAIHGSPYWYTNVSDDLTSNFTSFNGQGGQIIGGLNNLPQIIQQIDYLGGIAKINNVSINLVDDHETDRLAKFFRASVQSYTSGYCTDTVLRGDTGITVEDTSAISAGDDLFFSKETMNVDAVVNSTDLTVSRSQYSCFDSISHGERFRVIDEVEEGVNFGINSDGHHMHSGRWICIYRMHKFDGTWAGKKLVFAGVLETVTQSGGEWELNILPFQSLLKKNIGISYWSGEVKTGYWFSGESGEYYSLNYRKKTGGDINYGAIVLKTRGPEIEDIENNTTGIFKLEERLTRKAGEVVKITWEIDENSDLYGMYGNYYSSAFLTSDGNSDNIAVWADQRYETAIMKDGVFDIEPSLTAPTWTVGDSYHFLMTGAEKEYVVKAEYGGTDTFTVKSIWNSEFKPAMKPGIFADRFKISLVTGQFNIPFSRMILEVLESTGEGTNGTYDNLHSYQGLGIPQHLIDEESFQVLWERGIDGNLIITEERQNFADYFEDELKIMGFALIFSDEKLRLKEIIAPKYVDALITVDQSDVITKIPASKKNYIAPLETLQINYNNEEDKYIWNMKDPLQEHGASQTIELNSSILTEIPEWLTSLNYSRLMWLSSDPIEIKLETARNLWETVDVGDTIKLTHDFIQSITAGAYGADEAICFVKGKTESDKSYLTVIIRTARDASIYPIYAPAIELDTSQGSNGYTGGTVYFGEEPKWFIDRDITTFNCTWIGSDGSWSPSGTGTVSGIASGSTTATYSGDTTFSTGSATRIWLTFEDYDEL